MQQLNFPLYDFRLRKSEKGDEIFDIIRKKFVALTPEEWVRQNAVRFLMENCSVPAGRIKIEMPLKIQKLSKRADVVVFDDYAKPILIVECKAPSVPLHQAVFEQIAQYNMVLKVENLLITNGLKHYFCKIDFEKRNFVFENQIPDYLAMK